MRYIKTIGTCRFGFGGSEVVPDIKSDRLLAHKIKDINKKTTEVLDALVPGWKGFRQQPPRMNPEDVLDILTEIRNKTAQAIIDSCGIQEIAPHEAWEVLLGNDVYSSLRRKILKDLHNELGEYCKQLEATIQTEFGKVKKEEYWPRAWMVNDKSICAMLNEYPYFVPILNILWKRSKHLDSKESLDRKERYGINDRGMHRDMKGKLQHCALLPEFTYDQVARELGKSAQLVQKYLKAMCDIGILRMFHQKGRHPFTVYSIGYWSEWINNRFKVNPYLQEGVYGKKGPMYQKLVDFRIKYNVG